MNEWGHLEQRNEEPKKGQHGDQILRSPERAPVAGRPAPGDEHLHITPGLSDREQVERTADRIRDELLLTLEELDRRRDRLLDLRYQASRHRDVLLGAAVAAAVLTSVGLGMAVWRLRHREKILARNRLKALQRAWHHPQRVASSAEQRPLPVELGRKLVLIFGSALATKIAKDSVQLLVPSRHTQPAKG